jgi:hypothetical protein
MVDSEARLQEFGSEEVNQVEPAHYWREVLGSPYLQKPSLEMMKPEGRRILKFVSIRGEPQTKFNRKSSRWFEYDRAYVVAHMARYYGDIILGLERAELLKLITEAKALAKSTK